VVRQKRKRLEGGWVPYRAKQYWTKVTKFFEGDEILSRKACIFRLSQQKWWNLLDDKVFIRWKFCPIRSCPTRFFLLRYFEILGETLLLIFECPRNNQLVVRVWVSVRLLCPYPEKLSRKITNKQLSKLYPISQASLA